VCVCVCVCGAFVGLDNKPHKMHNTYIKMFQLYSSSIGTATLVGFGLFNYRWVFSAGRFLQSAVAAARQTPNLEDQWLERSNTRHQGPPRLKRRDRTPAAEDGTMGEKGPRILP